MRLRDRAGAHGDGRAAVRGKNGGIAKPRCASEICPASLERLDERVRGIGEEGVRDGHRNLDVRDACAEDFFHEGKVLSGDCAQVNAGAARVRNDVDLRAPGDRSHARRGMSQHRIRKLREGGHQLSANGLHIIEKDTYSVVKRVIPEGNTTCGLCSRLRRGTLYGYAEANGVTKIALGHHRDDILETFFLNIFYGGKLKAMPPKLLSDDKKNIIIRPLAYTREKDIERFAAFKDFPIIPCNLCGSQENLQRQAMKMMLTTWDKQFPGRLETIFTSLQNIAPSQLVDRNLFDFVNLMQETNTEESSQSAPAGLDVLEY